MTPQAKTLFNAWKHVYKTNAQHGTIGPNEQDAIGLFQASLRELADEAYRSKQNGTPD